MPGYNNLGRKINLVREKTLIQIHAQNSQALLYINNIMTDTLTPSVCWPSSMCSSNYKSINVIWWIWQVLLHHSDTRLCIHHVFMIFDEKVWNPGSLFLSSISLWTARSYISTLSDSEDQNLICCSRNALSLFPSGANSCRERVNHWSSLQRIKKVLPVTFDWQARSSVRHGSDQTPIRISRVLVFTFNLLLSLKAPGTEKT